MKNNCIIQSGLSETTPGTSEQKDGKMKEVKEVEKMVAVEEYTQTCIDAEIDADIAASVIKTGIIITPLPTGLHPCPEKT